MNILNKKIKKDDIYVMRRGSLVFRIDFNRKIITTKDIYIYLY